MCGEDTSPSVSLFLEGYSMSVVMMIKDFVSKLSPGAIFVTRQLLSMAKRSALDQGLHRLVKRGFLCRLARGVFCVNETEQTHTLQQVVETKLRAFGKSCVSHGSALLSSFGFGSHVSDEVILATDGRSSSFYVGKQRVKFHGTCANRVLAGESLSGRLIRALMQLKRNAVSPKVARQVLDKLSKQDFLELKTEKAPLMTGWMSDLLLHS